VGLGYAEVGEQKGDRLRGHGAAPVGVHGQPTRRDHLLLSRLGDERLRDRGRLGVLNRPAHDVATEDVQDCIEVVVGSLGGPEQLGYVPRPNLIGLLGEELGLPVGRVRELVTPFPDLAFGRQEAVHGPLGGEVTLLVEERRVDLSRGGVQEALAVKLGKDGRALGRRKRPGRVWAAASGLLAPVAGASGRWSPARLPGHGRRSGCPRAG